MTVFTHTERAHLYIYTLSNYLQEIIILKQILKG